MDIGKTHARMDGEIINALLALLDERIAVNVPSQVFGDAIDFL